MTTKPDVGGLQGNLDKIHNQMAADLHSLSDAIARSNGKNHRTLVKLHNELAGYIKTVNGHSQSWLDGAHNTIAGWLNSTGITQDKLDKIHNDIAHQIHDATEYLRPGGPRVAPTPGPATTGATLAGQHEEPIRSARPSQPATPPPATPASGSGAVYEAIARAAKENGVPLGLALAIAQHESGFDAGNTTGDNGHSWGLYQLYDKGEGAGMGNRRLDPYTNASTALKVVGQVLKANPGLSWGEIAAKAQRPADPAGYATTINGIVSRARNDPNYFATQLKGAKVSSGDFGGASTITSTGGGGRIPGATAPAGTGPAGAITVNDPTPKLPPGASAADIQKYVEQYYPDIVPYLHDKEIGPILLDAAQNGWSDARLLGRVQQTTFWKTHSQTQRAWDLLNTTDRATAHAQVQTQMASISQLVQQSGQQLSPIQIHDIAVNALRNGWSSDQIKAAVGAQSKIVVGPNGKPTGQAAVTLDTLKQQASQYLVPVSNQTLQTWVNQISNGQVPQAAFESYLKEQAKSLFPGMSVAIDSGVTPQQYTDPYRQLAAQTLEVPPDSVNFSDPKWSKALFQVDPKTGARTSMSLADWGKTLRSDPIYGYGKTAQAKSTAADFAENILNTFGAVGNYGGNG